VANTEQGVAPPDTDTDVGQLRYLIPDSSYEELDPPVAGQGLYLWFSDSALETFLDQADDDLDIAKVMAWEQIADYYASEAVSVTTDDLRVDLTKRAQFWRDKVTAAKTELAGDVFALASLGSSRCRHVELAGWYYGACSCS
jgi:hypothetical protein